MMKLPNSKIAYIPKEKVINYILSPTHVVGRFKAKFFEEIGFDETNADKLKESLLEIAQSGEVKEVVTSAYGIKYIIDGNIKAPNGNEVQLQTVWIIEIGQKRPRFVTTYPV